MQLPPLKKKQQLIYLISLRDLFRKCTSSPGALEKYAAFQPNVSECNFP